MPRPPDTTRGYPHLAHLLAIELATTPQRIARALEILNDAKSPLKANSYETTNRHNTHHHPGQTETAIQATIDQHQLHNHLNTIDTQLRGLTRILNEWAPQPLKPVNTVWCENHLKHGHHEPQTPSGVHCRWCNDVKRTYGTLPTKALLDLHDRGRRITETEYRRQLGRGKGTAA